MRIYPNNNSSTLLNGNHMVYRKIVIFSSIFIWFFLFIGVSQALSADLVIGSNNSGSASNPTVYDGGDYDRLLISGASYVIVRNASFASQGDGSADFGVAEISNANHITIENCSFNGLISGAEAVAACKGIDISGGSEIRIKNCSITRFADDGIEVSGNTNGLTVQGCTITEGYNCGTDGGCGPCYNGHTDAIEIWDVTDGTFSGNFVHLKTGTSAFITGGTNTNIVLENNIFYTPGCGFVVYIYNNIQGAKIFNNTFWQAKYGGIAIGGDTVDNLYVYNNILQSINYNHFKTSQHANHFIDNNILGESGQGYTPNTNDILASDPSFTVCPQLDGAELSNPTANDFQLQFASVAVNKGMSGAEIPQYDIASNMRDSAPDIGAWEYEGEATTSAETPTGLRVEFDSSNTNDTTSNSDASDGTSDSTSSDTTTSPSDTASSSGSSGSTVTSTTNYTSLEKPMRYVRAGASGSGTGLNWQDAYTSLPSNLNRDYVYFIADGNYGSYSFNDATDGGSYIYVIKAVEDDHGTDSGWLPQYGDGQALFNAPLNFYNGYYVIDGNGSHIIPSNDTNDYGFKVAANSTSLSTGILRIGASSGIDRVTIKYVHVYNTYNGSVGNATVGVRYYPSGACNYMKVQNCYLQNSGKDGIQIAPQSQYFLFERNYVERYGRRYSGTPDTHGQTVQAFISPRDMVFRWNIWESCEGQSLIAYAGTGETVTGIRFYGNVVFFTKLDGTDADSEGFGLSGGIIGNAWNAALVSDIFIYNNTFVNIRDSFTPSRNTAAHFPIRSPRYDVYGYNNIHYNCEEASFGAADEYGYNASGGYQYATGSSEQIGLESSIFIDYANYDFRLSGPTSSGYDIKSSLWFDSSQNTFFGTLDSNKDMYGNIRGSDGNLDRGAYEFVSN